jgi:uncharacterized membrane protein YbhN (UPF0104 family)
VGGESVLNLASGVLFLMGVVLGTLLLILFFPQTFLGVVRRIAGLLPGRIGDALVQFLTSFLQGLAALRDPRLLFSGLAWSFAFWGWNAVSFWLAFKAFGIEQGYIPALFVQGVIAIGVAVPAAPGFFGTFHMAAKAGLFEVYGASEAATLAFAFGYHLGGFIPVTLMGLWYAGHLGVSLNEIGKGAVAEVEREDASASKQDRNGKGVAG